MVKEVQGELFGGELETPEPEEPPKRKRLFVIDAFAYIFRSYYAIKHLEYNAVYGFTMVLKKLIEDQKPDYIAVAFDSPEPSFRNEIYSEYKANRQAPPEDLIPQIPLIQDVVNAFNIKLLQKDGYESDDIIGTVVHKALTTDIQTVIVSGDKDMLQLVKGDDVVVYDPGRKAVFLTEDDIPQHFGCNASQVVDLLTIWGDSSDNVPGVPGIGEKGAKNLLQEYGSLDNIYNNLEQIKRKSYREGLETARDAIDTMRSLVTICKEVPIELEIEALKCREIDMDAARQIFEKLNFKSLLNDLPVTLKECVQDYNLVNDLSSLKNLVTKLSQKDFWVFDVETSSIDPLEASLVGIAFALSKNDAYYIAIGHTGQEKSWREEVEKELKPLFANKEIKKCAHNVKFDRSILINAGWQLHNVAEDTMLISYLLYPNENRHGLDFLAEQYLQYKTITYNELRDGNKKVQLQDLEQSKVCQYAAEDADICLQIYHKLREEVVAKDVHWVYENIEIPLVSVLAKMEMTGVCIDTSILQTMSEEMAVIIAGLEDKIYELAGETFNINSTQQLGKILFDKLGIPPLKKTSKTKSYSTGQEVLEKLAEKGYELPEKLLEYRSVNKLKSTYVDALPKMVHPQTGRVHTNFNQGVTATGRLSSTNPNLQNIPIKTETGRKIRAAFIPLSDWTLITADYSQIELRIMAHFSQDATLVNAFRNNEDIHRRTASEIFDVDIDLVTDDLRRAAKSINFGLIYGMGEYRLAQELGVSRKEAKAYIAAYFKKMPGVVEFRDNIIEEAKKTQTVRTYFGRLRQIPEITSRNKNLRSQGERLAVNTIIQGTAADIIKLAMIRFDQELLDKNLKTNMLLQVHDELVLECPSEELGQIKNLIKISMEDVVNLEVPLTVDVHCGKNWRDAK